MNRTGLVGVGLSLALLSAVAACGDKDPTMNGSGGAGGAGTGGTGGTSASGGATPETGGTAGSDAGAVTGGTGGGEDALPAADQYLPFKIGNSWTYDVTQPNHVPETKVHKITKMQAIGGTGPFKDKLAYLVETQKVAGANMDATLSWQLREGPRVVRYRETSCVGGTVTIVDGSVDKCQVNEEDHWMPARVVIDELPTGMPYAAGLKWPETYMEWITTISYTIQPPAMAQTNSMQTDNWEVVESNAAAMTPAGMFTGCVLLKKTSMQGAIKQYTYCKGVGKVKEVPLNTATGQTEILTKYTVM